MIDKSYSYNIKPINILQDHDSKNLSSNIYNSYLNDSLDNMIINSNLENKNIIK